MMLLYRYRLFPTRTYRSHQRIIANSWVVPWCLQDVFVNTGVSCLAFTSFCGCGVSRGQRSVLAATRGSLLVKRGRDALMTAWVGCGSSSIPGSVQTLVCNSCGGFKILSLWTKAVTRCFSCPWSTCCRGLSTCFSSHLDQRTWRAFKVSCGNPHLLE